MNKFSIIFDLDGTLWNPSKTIVIAWENVIKREIKNYSFSEKDVQRICGMTTNEIANTLFYDLTEEERKDIMNKCLEEENKIIRIMGASLYDNVLEDLKILSKNYDLYIVSNCHKGYIESFLEYYKIDHLFKDIECHGNTGLSKSENIKLVVERNKIKECVYVGDTLYDYNSAKDNNIPFIYAKYGFGNVLNYDYVINNFSELKNIIEKTR